MVFSFRPLQRSDFPLLSEWLGRPHVHTWWEHDPEAVEADFGKGVDRIDPVEYFIVSLDGREIGFIQRYVMGDNPQWLKALEVVDCPADALGMDYFIAEPDLTGRGIGTAMIGAFIADTWRNYPDAPVIIVDVDPANPASWRAIEKNGFVRIWEGELTTGDPEIDGLTSVFRLERTDSSATSAG